MCTCIQLPVVDAQGILVTCISWTDLRVTIAKRKFNLKSSSVLEFVQRCVVENK